MTQTENFSAGLFHMLRRIGPSLKPHRVAIGFGVALVFAATGLEVIAPLLIGKVVDQAVGGNAANLMHYCGWYLGVIGAKAVLDTVLAYSIQSTGHKVMHELRVGVFGHTLRLGVGYFDRNPTGRLLTRVMNDIKSLGELFTASLSVLVLDVLVIIGTIVAMLWLDIRLGALTLLTFPAVVWIIIHFGGRLSHVYRRVRLHLSHINAFLGENISAIATIQRLGAEKQRQRTFAAIVHRHHDAQMEALTLFARVQPYSNTLNGVAVATVLGCGAYWVIDGRLSLGVVVTFLEYVRHLFQPIRNLVEKYNNYLSARVSAERIVGILDEAQEGYNSGVACSARVAPRIVFDQVGFTYPGRTKPAISGISFVVEAGTSVAIVGPTGSGKSTLVRLLLRFYEPCEGTISLLDAPLDYWSLSSVRQTIAVVHQDVYLIEGSLRENLSLGRPFSDDLLMEAVTGAQLWGFVKGRGGLDMRVFEGGSNLSIGERQLVAIARILMFEPPVVVLDEATANLDRIVEARLMSAVERIIRNRTSVVIAHRLSTIRSCHKVVVVDEGRVVQQGGYEELASLPGLFREFVNIHQAQGRECE